MDPVATRTPAVTNTIELQVNGTSHSLTLDPRVSLLDALRDTLQLAGTKKGCNQGACGACTVLLDGERVLACLTLAVQCEGQQVTTIEGVAGREADAIRKAWIAHDVPQCGYCQSGQVMSATALLQKLPQPSDRDIDLAMSGTICRCATYVRIRSAIKDAARTLGAKANA